MTYTINTSKTHAVEIDIIRGDVGFIEPGILLSLKSFGQAVNCCVVNASTLPALIASLTLAQKMIAANQQTITSD